MTIDIPDDFGEIFLNRINFRKYMKDECVSAPNLQLSVKYFVKIYLFPM